MEAARPITAGKHLWYMYNGKKPVTLKTKTGSAVLKKGDLFGVQNLNNRTDRLVMQKSPALRFLMAVEHVGEIIDDSKRVKEKVDFIEEPKAAPKQRPVKEPKPKPAKAQPKNLERMAAIRDAAKKAVKNPAPVKPKKKRESFDLDEDTFSDDYPNYDLHDFMP